MIQRVSIRTLVLMLELLVAVVALQYVTLVKPARADAVWLARDCAAVAQPLSGRIEGTTAP